MARKLGEPRHLLLFASPAYEARHGLPRRPADLARHACLVMSGGRTPTSWPFVQRGKRLTIEVKPALAVNSLVVLRDLVLAGHGIARLPELMAARPLREGRLRPVLAAHAGPGQSWYAVYPSARHLLPKQRILIELLEARFAKPIEV
jgi:DNA-binding transcriptional LysR family regulator